MNVLDSRCLEESQRAMCFFWVWLRPPHPHPGPHFAPTAAANHRPGSAESNQVWHNQKKKEKVLRRVAGDSASPVDGGDGRQPRALARPLSKIQSNPCMATPPQLCNLTHRKVLGYKHTTSLFPRMSFFFCHYSCEEHWNTPQNVSKCLHYNLALSCTTCCDAKDGYIF